MCIRLPIKFWKIRLKQVAFDIADAVAAGEMDSAIGCSREYVEIKTILEQRKGENDNE